MADSLLLLVRQAPGRGASWREAIEMALTGAAFGVETLLWLDTVPLKVLARRADHGEILTEINDFGIRCVARQEDLPSELSGVEGLPSNALLALRRDVAQMVVL